MRSQRPKALHLLGGLPLVEHVLRAVASLRAERVRVVVGYRAEAVQAALAGRGLEFVVQDPPLGTGHAVQVACRDVQPTDGVLLVVNGDLPLLRGETLAGLLAAHRASGGAATLLTAELADAGCCGRVIRGEDGIIRRIVEARDASPDERSVREVNGGVYAFECQALLPQLARLRPENAQTEYYLTDVVGLLAAAGLGVSGFRVADPAELLGVNTLRELADLDRRLRLCRIDQLLAAGVIIEDPESTRVGADVEIAADAVVRAFTVLEGRTRIGSGATVGPFVRLVDVEVGPDAQILDHSLLRQCSVGAGASVGPLAHVRPDSRIGPRAKVGNFVELKNTHLGEGSKAPHLSYLGDARIGSGVNVGAGTITCNYDGQAKHPTHIGSGAFVGSNATLVAPLSVGEGAYVAAGSVVTDDTPADALVLGRARQVVKQGWARRRREALERSKATP